MPVAEASAADVTPAPVAAVPGNVADPRENGVDVAPAPRQTEPAAVARPAMAPSATKIVEAPAPAHRLAWWLLLPVAALLLWAWRRTSRKSGQAQERTSLDA